MNPHAGSARNAHASYRDLYGWPPSSLIDPAMPPRSSSRAHPLDRS